MMPTTPPRVISEREKQSKEKIEHIALEVKELAKIYERTAKIWTILEEDEGIQ
jgi:hypothetical protein